MTAQLRAAGAAKASYAIPQLYIHGHLHAADSFVARYSSYSKGVLRASSGLGFASDLTLLYLVLRTDAVTDAAQRTFLGRERKSNELTIEREQVQAHPSA